MTLDLFANRIHEAHFVNGIIRLEFCVAARDAKGEFSPDAPVRPEDVRFTVNIPLTGFARSLAVLRQLAQTLQDKGLLRKPGEEGDRRRGDVGRRQPELVRITADSREDGSSGDDQPLV